MSRAPLLGVPRARLVELASAVGTAGATGAGDDAALEDFAAGAWSAVVEPGDAVGGALRRHLGPLTALRIVLEQVPDPEAEGAPAVEGVLTALAGTGHELGPAAVRRALARWRPRTTPERVLGAFRSAAHVGASLVRPGGPGWPPALDDLGDHAPAALWTRGPLPVPAAAAAVSVVGARASSSYGEQVTADLATALGDRGRVVVSGGAYGIDGTAHRAALLTPASTVAVLAGGVDHLYPRGHDELLRRVVAEGVVLAEVPCGTSPSRWRFLERNRLIACLSAATVVVEAGRRSGTLNTAGHASVLGRPVGAVPGPVTSPSSAGCHALLRSGLATCVTGVEDVLELTDGGLPAGDGPTTDDRDRLPPELRRVLDALSTRVPRTTSDLAVATGLAAADVAGVLAELELQGGAAERERGWVRRTPQGCRGA